MYYKNWISDWQYGGVAILFQWPQEVLQQKKKTTTYGPIGIFPFDHNTKRMAFKTFDRMTAT